MNFDVIEVVESEVLCIAGVEEEILLEVHDLHRVHGQGLLEKGREPLKGVLNSS